jgi:hypothetical protein
MACPPLLSRTRAVLMGTHDGGINQFGVMIFRQQLENAFEEPAQNAARDP